MAKTQDLKRRIRSISNTMQLTRAMKMVSAAKLRRAQERILKARPYAHSTLRLLRSLATRTGVDEHPLLRVSDGNRMLVVVVTADKGLCGAFNSGIIRTSQQFIAGHPGREVGLLTIGRKGRDFYARRTTIKRQWTDVFRDLQFSLAKEIAQDLIERYLAAEVDSIHLVYNEFKSAIQARPIVQQLLPVEPAELDETQPTGDYIYEPSAPELFAVLLPHYVEVLVFHAMLESSAAELAARMTAMDSATKNAGELIESLTLTMNRVRQSSITTELIEVVSGAEALG